MNGDRLMYFQHTKSTPPVRLALNDFHLTTISQKPFLGELCLLSIPYSPPASTNGYMSLHETHQSAILSYSIAD